jgi:vanillate monooxygenase ferredoxin subunit
MSESLSVQVTRIVDEAVGVKSFELRRHDGGTLPAFTAGSHILVHLEGVTRSYSLANHPDEDYRYLIAVRRDPDGNGSVQMHDKVREGQTLEISAPANNFQLHHDAQKSILIAGGIGITPIMAMVRRLHSDDSGHHLYYCARDASCAAFRRELDSDDYRGSVTYVFDGGNPGNGIDLTAVLAEPEPGTHVYVCGPGGLIDAVRETAAANGWPAASVHHERFISRSDGKITTRQDGDASFEVEIASTGDVFVVEPGSTILETLLDKGFDPPRLCEEGYCGTCLTGVLSGTPDHRDDVLDEAERAANDVMTICCSRALTKRLKLDL